MEWEPLGTTSQYKQPIIITHAKVVSYLTTWASFHPRKHITHLRFHCSRSHCLCPFSLSDFRLAKWLSQVKKRGRFGPERGKKWHLMGALAPAVYLHVCSHIDTLLDSMHGVQLYGCNNVPWHSWSKERWADEMRMDWKQDL